MRRKHILVAAASLAAFLVLAFLVGHYLSVKQISRVTGVGIPFTSSVSSVRNGGMMGGTIETWVIAPHFSALLEQCTAEDSYTHGIINYSSFRVTTSQFEERGMGKSPGCVKEVKSPNSTKLIALDNGFIYISEQWF